jgi:diketogulonate reductase-like aldo/keto reductase
MQYRKLGRTGLKVSEISLGSWLTYGNAVENDTAVKTIDRAYELGINSFDTANVYAGGEAEKVVGELWENIGGIPTFWPPRCSSPWGMAPTTGAYQGSIFLSRRMRA